MKVGVEIGKMTGHYEIVNFLSGYKDMEQFLFRVPKWPIGGMYFDGIMRTEHISRVRRPLSGISSKPLGRCTAILQGSRACQRW